MARTRSHSRSRSRSRDSKISDIELPHDAKQISESDYFLKSTEFRVWLKDEKRKYFDELSSDKARSYFRKFMKAWNKGKLPRSLYAGIDPTTLTADSQTGYKWSFASRQSKSDAQAVRAAREEVGAATTLRESAHRASTSASGSGRIQGPTLPSASDLQLAREAEAEQRGSERTYKRKRDKLEAKERIEDMVGPKEIGREGMLEKKRARRENDREFRERGDEGLEADESTLMGGGDSFRAAVARREAAKSRRQQKGDEAAHAARERADAHREKEKATMDMLQQLAKQRFG